MNNIVLYILDVNKIRKIIGVCKKCNKNVSHNLSSNKPKDLCHKCFKFVPKLCKCGCGKITKTVWCPGHNIIERKDFYMKNFEKFNKTQKRENHPRWNKGLYGCNKLKRDGYIYVYRPNHPNATKQGQITLHRLIMEKYIKRFLLSSEIVHHIDGNRENNKIGNLQLLKNLKEHNKIHNQYRDIRGRFSTKISVGGGAVP